MKWDGPASTAGLAGYKIYVNGKEYVTYIPADATGYTIEGLEAGKTYNVEYSYTSDAKDYNGQFELWINDQKVSDNQKSFTVPNTVGNYKLAIKATGTGNTLSQPVNIIIVPANTTGQNIEGFTSTDIGPVRTAGADYYDAQTGTLVTTGAGRVGILKYYFN